MINLGTYLISLVAMCGLIFLTACAADEPQKNSLLTDGLIQCTFDAIGNKGTTALEPLSLKLGADDNEFEILNDPFERTSTLLKYELNELALILRYEYQEILELYPHQCQYKINRVDGVGAHSCILAETDHYQSHYPHEIECEHVVELKF